MSGGRLDTRGGGFVLVSVLWILAILTVVALGFGRRAMIERRSAWYELDRAQALQTARGAVTRAMFEITNQNLIEEYEHPGRPRSFIGLQQRWAQPLDLFSEGLYSEQLSGPAQGNEEGKGGSSDICRYVIQDAFARISINHAPEEMLAELDGLKLNVIRKLMARRSSDDTKDAPIEFLAVEELRTLADIDDDVWYGEGDDPGLRDMLTVWGHQDGLININTASAPVLRAIPEIGEEEMDAIIGYRAGGDGVVGTTDDRAFHNLDQVSEKLEVEPENLQGLRKYCTTHSYIFTITATATRRNGKVVARCMATVMSARPFPRILQWREDTLGA